MTSGVSKHTGIQREEVLLIIHADDAGLAHSVNMATIDAMENGIVSSTSMLVTAPGFLEFAEYARSTPSRDFGVHLALTSEWSNYRWGPVADQREVRSLLDPSGMFWNDVELVAKHALVEHAELELTNQIERALAAGIRISHLDTHEGVLFSRTDFVELYARLGNRYGLPILVTNAHFLDPITGSVLRELFGQSHDQFQCYPNPILSSVVQIYDDAPHEYRKSRYMELLRHLPSGANQIIVHCGVDDVELRSITRMSAVRHSDYQLMLDHTLQTEIDRLRITLADWHDLTSRCL